MVKAVKKEKPIGIISHWYGNINVAVIKLAGALAVGDKIKVKKGDVEFEEVVESMQLNHEAIKSGKKGQDIAIKLAGLTKEGAEIYKIK